MLPHPAAIPLVLSLLLASNGVLAVTALAAPADLEITESAAPPTPALTARAAPVPEPEHEQNINWLWQQLTQTRVGTSFFVVSVGPPLVLRGTASGHDCVVNAIKAARNNDSKLALRWLMAGQAHNKGAMKSIEKAGQVAVDYAAKTYGSLVK